MPLPKRSLGKDGPRNHDPGFRCLGRGWWELKGDVLPTRPRLAVVTGVSRLGRRAERIGDARGKKILPRNHGLPGTVDENALYRVVDGAGLETR